jgi:hypothetical protein
VLEAGGMLVYISFSVLGLFPTMIVLLFWAVIFISTYFFVQSTRFRWVSLEVAECEFLLEEFTCTWILVSCEVTKKL